MLTMPSHTLFLLGLGLLVLLLSTGPGPSDARAWSGGAGAGAGARAGASFRSECSDNCRQRFPDSANSTVCSTRGMEYPSVCEAEECAKEEIACHLPCNECERKECHDQCEGAELHPYCGVDDMDYESKCVLDCMNVDYECDKECPCW